MNLYSQSFSRRYTIVVFQSSLQTQMSTTTLATGAELRIVGGTGHDSGTKWIKVRYPSVKELKHVWNEFKVKTHLKLVWNVQKHASKKESLKVNFDEVLVGD